MTRHSKREVANAIDELGPATGDRERPPKPTDEENRTLDELFGPSGDETPHRGPSDPQPHRELYARLDRIDPLEWRDGA